MYHYQTFKETHNHSIVLLIFQAVVSNQRLKEFLVADELRPEDIDRLEMLDDGEKRSKTKDHSTIQTT